MGQESNEVKTRTLTPEEIEKLLRKDFGGKLQPVDNVKLAKQQKQRARYRDNKQ